MCIICLLYNNKRLTAKEAKKATWELVEDEEQDLDHLRDIYAKFEELEKND